MKKIISSSEITSNNVISYVNIDDNPNSKYIYFAEVINNLYSSFINYVELSDSNTFIDYVEVNFPDNKPFIHFVKIISDIDFYIRKPKDIITIQDFKSFIFEKKLNDVVVFDENITFNTIKSISENVEISDSFSLEFLKPLSDNYNISDSVYLTVNFKRVFPESIEFTDSIRIDLSKKLQDLFRLNDINYYNFIKNREEIFDVVDYIDSKSFIKSPTNVFEFEERYYFDIQKPLFDNGIISDTFTFHLVKKPFVDVFGYSDSFDGILNKIKYEAIIFSESIIKETFKSIKENTVIIDKFSFFLVKTPFNDSFQIADITNLQNNKSRTEQISLVDSNAKSLTKPLSEELIVQETKSFNIQKYPFYDTTEIYQKSIKLLEKTKNELISFIEYNTKNSSKLKQEPITFNDYTNINFIKSNFDYFNTSDYFNFSFNKQISEMVHIADLFNFNLGRSFNELVSISENSRGLLSDYSSEGTYFSEDYVGETIIFN